ncbi:MAG: AraC family transcriptional regulator [Rubrivivax sp.]|nr:MAG: AraC family transcriptional regulator [Rubrivivax sp.]
MTTLPTTVAGIEKVSYNDIEQTLPHLVTAKARNYQGGTTPVHHHPRAQLIYAGEGVMRVETSAGSWVVPPLRGVWIPAGVDHQVVMLGTVAMRTLYFRLEAAPDLPDSCCLVEVRPLLRELIYALVDEPVDYAQAGRGGLIAALVLKELRFLRAAALHLPVPTEPRLQKLCRALIDQPDSPETLETWADQCATSSRTLARLFHRETGMSFRHWRQQARLVEALGQLGKGESVARVADRLGYRSPSAFTAMFKKAMGVEPSRYFEGDTPS